jgi:hypothetical protein
MQFLVYLTVLMVSVSTVLLEIHWLTTPPPQPRPAVQTATAPPPRPKVEGPNAELSPVYPKRLQPPQPAPVQDNVNAAAGSAPGRTMQTRPAETTVTPTGPDNPNRTATSAATSDSAHNAQAYAPQPRQNDATATAAPNSSCNVQACASAYRSFRASDCTYQPFDGPRRVCDKMSEQRADREQGVEPQRRSSSRSSDVREVDRRAGWRVYDEDEDEDDEPFLFRRSRRW